MVDLSNNSGTYCQFNDRKISKKNNKNDLETRNFSLRDQYAKLGGMKEASAIETTPKDSNLEKMQQYILTLTNLLNKIKRDSFQMKIKA
jgi:hypothetical protein